MTLTLNGGVGHSGQQSCDDDQRIEPDSEEATSVRNREKNLSSSGYSES